jgi:hypothetical protein
MASPVKTLEAWLAPYAGMLTHVSAPGAAAVVAAANVDPAAVVVAATVVVVGGGVAQSFPEYPPLQVQEHDPVVPPTVPPVSWHGIVIELLAEPAVHAAAEQNSALDPPTYDKGSVGPRLMSQVILPLPAFETYPNLHAEKTHAVEFSLRLQAETSACAGTPPIALKLSALNVAHRLQSNVLHCLTTFVEFMSHSVPPFFGQDSIVRTFCVVPFPHVKEHDVHTEYAEYVQFSLTATVAVWTEEGSTEPVTPPDRRTLFGSVA